MPQLLFTLLSEGPSDDALMYVVTWLLEQPSLGLLPDVELVGRFVGPADLRADVVLDELIAATSRDLPAHLLFVHRDADSSTRNNWATAIRTAAATAARRTIDLPPVIPVVPVREMEAWLLADAPAIRRAAGNPNGSAALDLPAIHEIERCPDPKQRLEQALRAAMASGRRSRQRAVPQPREVAEVTTSFERIRQLPAFDVFEREVRDVIRDQRWPERLG
jgi:hypothetical protein